MIELDTIDKRLLDEFQRGFPLTPRPYTALAEELDLDEDDVMERLRTLQDGGAVSRIGAIVAPQRAGWSTLAAMAVPPDRMKAVADLVSAYPAVNHNYEREHRLNLWFVVTGPDEGSVGRVLEDIRSRTSIDVLNLPMIEAYRLDLGFPLQWS